MTEQRHRRPSQMPEGASQRLPVTVLLTGGILLVLLTQQSYASLIGPRRLVATVLLLVGLISFGLAIYFSARPDLPERLTTAAGRGTAFFGVSSGQLVLLFYAPCFALLAGLAAGESLLALHLPVSLLAYLLALAAVLAGSYRAEGASERGLSKWDGLIMCALVILALILRLVNLERLPPTLSGDEGSSGLQAVGFIDGEANNPFTVGWFSFPSLFFTLQSVGIRLFGQTTAGLRVMSALGGALTVAGLYWMARTIFDRLIAVMAAIVLATLHYHIHFSRLGLNNIWDGFFAVLVLAGVAYGWVYGRRWAFLLAGLALGLGQYFYVSFRAMPIILLVWFTLALIVDRSRFRCHLPDVILLALAAIVVALPLNAYFVSHPDEFLAPMRRVSVFDGWLALTSQIEDQPQVMVLGRQIAKTAMGITHEPLRHWYNPGAPLLLAGSAGLFLLGLLWLLLRPRLLHWLVLIPILGVILLGGLSQDAPASQRYVMATPLIALVVAIPLGAGARWLWLVWPRFRPLIAVALILLLGWIAWTNLSYYFFDVFDSYVLGGHNTEVATAVARYLDDQDSPPEVYFFGLPRMGYYSLSTIPYLVPQVKATDIAQPIEAEPDWKLRTATAFLFLPERADELAHIQSRYPGGETRRIDDQDGDWLFLAYEVASPSAAGP